MIRDLYNGARYAARAFGAQYADAQDAAQDAALSAIKAGDRALTTAFGYTVAKRSLARRVPTVELPLGIAMRTTEDRSDLVRAIDRSGARGWYSASRTEKKRIRADLARALRAEGWGR